MDELQIETGAGQLGDARILRIVGPMTMHNLFDFQETLRRNVAAITIVDMSAVPYIDSAALGSILGLHVSCEASGRRYALAAVPERLETLFQMTRVDQILLRFSTVEEAETSLRSSGIGQ